MTNLDDLNTSLNTQFTRLTDPTLDAATVTKEVERSDAMVRVSESLLRVAEVRLKEIELRAALGTRFPTTP